MNQEFIVIGAAAGIVAVLVWLARNSWFRVDEGSVGVVTSFGAAAMLPGNEGKRLKTFQPGIHFKMPWEKVIVIEMMEQAVDLSGDRGRTAMAADGTKLRFDSILRYQPVEERLADYLFGMRKPREHVTGLFTCLLRNEIANFGAASKSEPTKAETSDKLMLRAGGQSPVPSGVDMGSFAQLRRERAQLNHAIKGFCHGKLEEDYGLRFNAVDLVDILPPDELAEALNAVIHAQSEAGTRYFRAEGDCQQQVLSAEQGLEIARARALAVEREMRTLGEFLRKLDESNTLALYVARRRAEVMSDAKTLYLQAPTSSV